MVFNIFALPLIGSAIILLIISFWAWRLRATQGAKPFALLMLSCAIYSLGYALEISSILLEEVLFWLKVEYLGLSVLPALLILFALDYTGRSHRLTLPLLAAIFVIPLVTLLLFYTNESHRLFYQAIQMNEAGPFPVISFERGPWYWVQSAYSSMAVLYGNVLFLLMWLNAAPVYRRQIAMMLAGSLIPWGAFIFYQTRLISWNLDFNPFALTLSGLLFFWGFFRYRLFDLSPIARTTLFEDLPDGVLILDGKLRIVDVNAAARQYLQVTPGAIGKPALEVLETWPDLAHLVGNSVHTYRELQRDIQDKHCWFRLEILPLQGKDGADLGQMILLRDITDRIQAEQALQQSEQVEQALNRSLENMQELDRLKTNFLSSVSHELRTPLTSILGFSTILKKRFAEVIIPVLDLDDKKMQKTVRQIQGNMDIISSQVRHLTSLINNVLDIAMMEAGQVEWKKTTVQLKEIVESAIEDTASLLQQKGLFLTLEIEDDLPEIAGDQERLVQLFKNLISNGAKFTEQGGITIRAVVGAEGEILVSVTDTGKGIEPGEQEIIFEKFKQTGDILTDKPAGIGLGLPICKEIVEHHGGRIWLESQPGQGSIFYFNIPSLMVNGNKR